MVHTNGELIGTLALFADLGNVAVAVAVVVGVLVGFCFAALALAISVVSPRALDRNRKDDYVSAWTISLQQSLPLRLIATLNYLGNKGTDVLTTTYVNLAVPPTNSARVITGA